MNSMKRGEATERRHSLCDAVRDLHVLSGDEASEILQAVDKLQLPAELGTDQEGQERDA